MEYSLEGQEISRICLDYAVTFETVDGTELRIESVFRLTSADGSRSVEIDPNNLSDTGETVVHLLHQQIVLATMAESGALALRCARGERIECEPDEQFEAWTLATAAGERMVCLPGGGIAHWPGSLP